MDRIALKTEANAAAKSSASGQLESGYFNNPGAPVKRESQSLRPLSPRKQDSKAASSAQQYDEVPVKMDARGVVQQRSAQDTTSILTKQMKPPKPRQIQTNNFINVYDQANEVAYVSLGSLQGENIDRFVAPKPSVNQALLDSQKKDAQRA